MAPIPIRSAPDDINWVQLKEIGFNSDKERLTQTREGQTMLQGSFQSTGKTRSLPVCIIFHDVDKLSIIVHYLKKKAKKKQATYPFPLQSLMPRVGTRAHRGDERLLVWKCLSSHQRDFHPCKVEYGAIRPVNAEHAAPTGGITTNFFPV